MYINWRAGGYDDIVIIVMNTSKNFFYIDIYYYNRIKWIYLLCEKILTEKMIQSQIKILLVKIKFELWLVLQAYVAFNREKIVLINEF